MGSCFSVGLNTDDFHLDGNSQADSGNLKSFSFKVPEKATSNFHLDSMLGEGNSQTDSGNLKSFGFKVLKKATRNFHPDSMLGEGVFSSVFKGWIDEQSLAAAKPDTGTAVAVKRINHEGIRRTREEWLSEIKYFGQLNHPNLIKLIGYCLEGDHQLLVYEFMCRRSLENFRGGSNFHPFSWNHRVKVALGVAKGLAYLHSDPGPKPRNLYLRPSNILIDSSYNAKLSAFGLAKVEEPNNWLNHNISVYEAPEYSSTGHYSTKCEIYSFGVVLLELLTGRRCFDLNRPSDEEKLVEFVQRLLKSKQKIVHIMDSSIKGQYSSTVATQAVLLAMECLKPSPKRRPCAQEVVNALEDIYSGLQNASESSTTEPVRKDI